MKKKYNFCSNNKSEGMVDIIIFPDAPKKKLYCKIFSSVEYKDCSDCPHYSPNFIVQFEGVKPFNADLYEKLGFIVINEKEWQRDKDLFEKWERDSNKERKGAE